MGFFAQRYVRGVAKSTIWSGMVRLASGHRSSVLELGSLPSASHEDVAKGLGCVPNIDVPDVERAEAKTKHVGRENPQ